MPPFIYLWIIYKYVIVKKSNLVRKKISEYFTDDVNKATIAQKHIANATKEKVIPHKHNDGAIIEIDKMY